MSRLPAHPKRSELTGEELAAFDSVSGRWRPPEPDKEVVVGGHFGAMLHSPMFAQALSNIGILGRTSGLRKGSFSDKDREWCDQVVSAHLKSAALQELHLPDALAVGVRLEAIEALRAGRDSELTKDELLLATYARQVLDGTVTDETFQSIREHFGNRGAVEFTVWVTYVMSAIRLKQAFVGVEPSDEEVGRMLADFKSGKRTPPADWRDRIPKVSKEGGR